MSNEFIDLSPEALPLDVALRSVESEYTKRALVEVSQLVQLAKCMLMQNRVRNFTATDTVELVRIIMDRETELASRGEA